MPIIQILKIIKTLKKYSEWGVFGDIWSNSPNYISKWANREDLVVKLQYIDINDIILELVFRLSVMCPREIKGKAVLTREQPPIYYQLRIGGVCPRRKSCTKSMKTQDVLASFGVIRLSIVPVHYQ
jgi:hypothetical protein